MLVSRDVNQCHEATIACSNICWELLLGTTIFFAAGLLRHFNMLTGIMNHQVGDGDQVGGISLTYFITQFYLICKTLCEECSLEPTMKNMDMDPTLV